MNRKALLGLLSVVSLLSACDGKTGQFSSSAWFSELPFSVIVSPNVPRSKDIKEWVADGIGQMGGRVVDGSPQAVYVIMGEPEDCTENTGARTFYWTQLALCPPLFDPRRGDAVIRSTLLHEMGHAFANRFDHLPCSTMAIMAESDGCRPKGGYSYIDLDIEYICSAGHFSGGVCSR